MLLPFELTKPQEERVQPIFEVEECGRLLGGGSRTKRYVLHSHGLDASSEDQTTTSKLDLLSLDS